MCLKTRSLGLDRNPHYMGFPKPSKQLVCLRDREFQSKYNTERVTGYSAVPTMRSHSPNTCFASSKIKAPWRHLINWRGFMKGVGLHYEKEQLACVQNHFFFAKRSHTSTPRGHPGHCGNWLPEPRPGSRSP